jgi:hypothetical protein
MGNTTADRMGWKPIPGTDQEADSHHDQEKCQQPAQHPTHAGEATADPSPGVVEDFQRLKADLRTSQGCSLPSNAIGNKSRRCHQSDHNEDPKDLKNNIVPTPCFHLHFLSFLV